MWLWASAHRGKWGQLTPRGKMDEKLKSENMQKEQFSLCLCYILRAIRAVRCRERRYADHIFIQLYFRVLHFVVKFSKKKFIRVRRQGGIDHPNQNPADVPGCGFRDVVVARLTDSCPISGVAMGCAGWAKSRRHPSAGTPEFHVVWASCARG